MIANTNLQQIVSFSNQIASEQYSNQAVALQQVVPGHLQALIQLAEEANFSRRIRMVVNDNIISSYRETLDEINLFNKTGRSSGAAELLNWFRCEIEMARIFFEGLYKYLSNDKSE